MSITDAENNLFAEWRAKREGFVADGVADEQAYLQSNRKLLFVLKEVNDGNGGGWDLREYLRQGARAQTWANITRWTEGIRKIGEDFSWDELVEVDEDRRVSTLRSIAAINLKKSPGGHTSDPEELARISREDKVFLNRQFSLYAPDIVVCCGTSGLFHALVTVSESIRLQKTRRGIAFHEYQPGKFIVDYAHPEARCASHLLYYGLVDAMREILTPSAS
ncbi:MAG: hypothetical protein QM776_01555 [Rhodocyclaceae bacterium]